MFSGKPRKKICRFCMDNSIKIDYKNQKLMQHYITETCKILPARMTGTCASHQRKINKAIKRARHIALLSYAATEL